jgi:hypothetical protein
MASHFKLTFSFYSIVGSVASGMLGLEHVDLLGLALFVIEFVCWVELEEGLLHWDGASSGRSSTGGVIVRVLSISGSGIRSSGLWVSVIVGNASWFNLLAWGSRFSIFWSISTIAEVSSTVNAIWAITSMAKWEFTWLSLNGNWVPLSVMEWLSLHGDILTKVFITSHAFSKLNITSDSWDTVLRASSLNLNKSGG